MQNPGQNDNQKGCATNEHFIVSAFNDVLPPSKPNQPNQTKEADSILNKTFNISPWLTMVEDRAEVEETKV